jgi:hypothetical protein
MAALEDVFAKTMSRWPASRLRLRPILMTAFAIHPRMGSFMGGVRIRPPQVTKNELVEHETWLDTTFSSIHAQSF